MTAKKKNVRILYIFGFVFCRDGFGGKKMEIGDIQRKEIQKDINRFEIEQMEEDVLARSEINLFLFFYAFFVWFV